VEAGKIGLWTKADAVTYFDGLNITQKGSDAPLVKVVKGASP